MIGAFVPIDRPYAREWFGYVIAENGCWIWAGNLTAKGYGSVMTNYRSTPAHRFVYEMVVGPVPTGLQLDHLCRNRACVNPSHLEPVTARENVRRGESIMAERARQTRCDAGHRFDVVTHGGRHGRACLECKREKNREWWQSEGKSRRNNHGVPNVNR